MSWLPVDCHAHTTLSDGALSVAELIEAARARGVRPAVADHLSYDVGRCPKTMEAVRDYLDELDRWEVLRGGEFCWHDTLWRDLPEELARRFTHRIGSIHAIPLGGGLVRHNDAVPDRALYMEAWVSNAERLAAEMPVDIMAHPTLTTKPLRLLDPEELWSEAHEERVIQALYRAGIAFEVSNRYPPHERILRRAVAHGVRISLGSDGHLPHQVADIAMPLEMARAAGVADEALYDPALHGSRTGAAVAA